MLYAKISRMEMIFIKLHKNVSVCKLKECIGYKSLEILFYESIFFLFRCFCYILYFCFFFYISDLIVLISIAH